MHFFSAIVLIKIETGSKKYSRKNHKKHKRPKKHRKPKAKKTINKNKLDNRRPIKIAIPPMFGVNPS